MDLGAPASLTVGHYLFTISYCDYYPQELGNTLSSSTISSVEHLLYLTSCRFGVEGLIAAGESSESESICRAMEFLLSRQNANGGWGESYVACVNKEYPLDGTGKGFGTGNSGVVQTAWAGTTPPRY